MGGDPYRGTGFWQPKPEERAALRQHLLAELPPGHVLYSRRDTLEVEARAQDGDDVIVRTGCVRNPLALVQMTWRGRPEIAPFLPETTLFASDDALRMQLGGA